jgi:hypothetical protein
MDKIVRYETSLERSLIRTLHEFQRLQGYRAGRWDHQTSWTSACPLYSKTTVGNRTIDLLTGYD